MDLTIANYVIAGVVGYYALLFLISRSRTQPAPSPGFSPTFVVLVPARNEESVLHDTLANLCGLGSGEQCRVLIIDDGSTDATAAIADRWARDDGRVRVIHRGADQAGRGKSDVLNQGYRAIRDWRRDRDPWLAGDDSDDAGNSTDGDRTTGRRRAPEVIVAIVDADGRLQPDVFAIVAPYFADSAVASVQIGVSIANAGDSTLARMQDIEFVGFSWLVQIARDRFGSSGLGGNGQFTRLDALIDLGEQPWNPTALTEDLDLGLRLVTAGWRTKFCHLTWVDQQGLDRWRPLLRQRTRWIQGHYQCWQHIPALLRARNVRLSTRLDLLNYLVLVVTVLVVSAMAIINGLASFGLLSVSNNFLGFVPEGIPKRTVALALSVLPLVIFMWTYQRHSARPFRWYELPTFAVIFTLYGYVWLLTSVRALARLATGRNGWVKTPRVATSPLVSPRGDTAPPSPTTPPSDDQLAFSGPIARNNAS